MKKVIFVGGTAYSGSTFFHMVLANDPRGFACGEIRWLFRPQKPSHVNRACACGDPACDLWRKVLRNGEENLYKTIFELHPEVEFIVDSSKNPFWIRNQSDNLQRQGIQSKHILIWKTPLEFAHSTKKKNRLTNWDTEWINYHRLYFAMVPEWRSVCYSALTQDPLVLAKACERMDIPYFPGKEQFWEKVHHVYDGNRSARFHLYEEERAKKMLRETEDDEKINEYRSIYYNNIEDRALEAIVVQSFEKHKLFRPILDSLSSHSVVNETVVSSDVAGLELPALIVHLRKLKHWTMDQVGHYKYGRALASVR